MSLLLGQSDSLFSLKRGERVNALYNEQNDMSTMTSAQFAFYLTCLCLGKMGKFFFFVFLCVFVFVRVCVFYKMQFESFKMNDDDFMRP